MLFLPNLPVQDHEKLFEQMPQFKTFPLFVEMRWVLQSERYRRFVLKTRENSNKLFILDNSCALGEGAGPPIDFSTIVDFAQQLKPVRIIIPDVLNNTMETIRLYNECRPQLPLTPGITSMGVVQGTTMEEMVDMTDYWHAERAHIHGIGVPYKVMWATPLYPTDFNMKYSHLKVKRDCLRRYGVMMELKQRLQLTLPIHLLGLHDPYELMLYSKGSKEFFINDLTSCDSRLPYLCAKNYLKYSSEGGLLEERPHASPMDVDSVLNEQQFECLLHNLACTPLGLNVIGNTLG